MPDPIVPPPTEGDTPPDTGGPTIPDTPPSLDTVLGGDTPPQGGDGTTPPASGENAWLEGLPEDIRGNERLTGFKSVAELAKAYAEAQLAPTIPEATAYKLPENFPVKDIGVWANKLGITQEQLDNILALDSHIRKSEYEGMETLFNTGLTKLFEEWGPEKNTNITYAKEFINHFDETGELKELLNKTRAGNNPVIVKFLAKVGKAVMAEDGFVRSKGASTSVQKSAADIIFDAS